MAYYATETISDANPKIRINKAVGNKKQIANNKL